MCHSFIMGDSKKPSPCDEEISLAYYKNSLTEHLVLRRVKIFLTRTKNLCKGQTINKVMTQQYFIVVHEALLLYISRKT